METRSIRIIRICLWVLGWAIGLYGSFIGSSVLGYSGFVVMGATMLFFHREFSKEFMDLNPSTNKTFIRISTPIVGLAFLLGGLIDFVKSFL
ncbi:MAG: hypothetical protein A3I44_03320 [Candidatus Sungbacteria bacterium RIFCSPLOWO2_02_FULL_51_17]|uniref:Uncharacterized protein n=1 Tax=Candidatus Sungbacteria bacterium RIFCSPHIGHO2_02_FULL_51_29 TaxID=1802273 RepID=A0A1G2KZ36_9BACT|nr:MAG: hypothetical protein A2676_06235 [Candidatus Sungbacteria bacterium RIFCSPHIGHO2_01_FULL_51_22]OHA03772.1 MAG: hypothetical protein A3C16_03365 [Candidatus Sungbacteria bacterium RIFCSPHIGHO2_02_FULL_51_29]OHA10530.1 MAG: hypothetical protein A3I44_03320 [Candidatus Sungbacteria bacterium RIFCSPLOWO2_02_FULL_51_17]